jgi:dihydroorotate dehydrogenase (fumarate)
MVDLSTVYMGLQLKNPLVASASPLCEDVDNIKRMEDAGAAAVVLHSLFEEQITLEEQTLNQYLLQGTEHFAEALTYFPDVEDFKFAPDEYLDHIRKAKQSVEIPIIGSLNGISSGGWIRYAQEIASAGADALELNIYYLPTDPDKTSQEVEDSYIELVKVISKKLKIPVAVKLNPYLSSIPYLSKKLCEAGASALVYFNRFYQPDLDVETLEVRPNLKLSNSDELLLRLRWVAILYARIDVDFAITGGVHTGEDVVKTIMAGAKVAMMTSALLKKGIDYLQSLRANLVEWMEAHNYETIKAMQGVMSQKSVAEPAAFERANYMKVLKSFKL